MSTADTVALLAPQFAGDALINDYAEIAVPLVPATTWGTLYGLAVAYMTCHLMQIAANGSAGGGSASGAVASRKAGDVAIGYTAGMVTSSKADAWLAETAYGRALIGLRSTLSITGARLAGPVIA